MKSYLLVLSILCAWLQMSAQSPKPSRWSVALTAGPAIPVGTFAGTHNSNAGDKTVSTGGLLELSGSYRIWRFFSAAVAFDGQLNRGNGISSDLGPMYLYNSAAVAHIGVFGKDWQIARVLAGGLFTLPLSKKGGPTLMLRALAGIQKTRTPAVSYPESPVITTYPGTFYVRANSLSTAFSYQLDAGLKWKLSSKWAFLVFAGYNGCRPSFSPHLIFYPPGEMVPGPSGAGPLMSNRNTSLPTGTISIRAGLSYSL
ncbi:MAG TPA: hypothetical protein VGQ51_06410 [Puia sp.]|jgi:hypothetical protein|nr:hypothetical protein [Puia sp.]